MIFNSSPGMSFSPSHAVTIDPIVSMNLDGTSSAAIALITSVVDKGKLVRDCGSQSIPEDFVATTPSAVHAF